MKTILLAALLCAAFLQLVAPHAARAAEALTGSDIVRMVSDQMNQETTWGVMKLTIVTSSGKEREFTYESFTSDEGEKTVIRYITPVRVKGQAMLLLNNADDIWSYEPRTDRVRKLATHAKRQKMQGSDFTYEDFGGGDSFVTDFDAARMADEKVARRDCYKIVLRKKEESGSAHARLVMWVVKENLVPVLIDYYGTDDPDLPKKRLTQSDIKDIDGVPTAMKAVMHNNLDETETALETLKLKYNVRIEKSRFTKRGFYR